MAGSPEEVLVSHKKPLPDDLIVDPEKMNEAMARAAQDAYRLHKQSGLPIVAWRDGKVVWIPAEEIKLEEPTPGDDG